MKLALAAMLVGTACLTAALFAYFRGEESKKTKTAPKADKPAKSVKKENSPHIVPARANRWVLPQGVPKNLKTIKIIGTERIDIIVNIAKKWMKQEPKSGLDKFKADFARAMNKGKADLK